MRPIPRTRSCFVCGVSNPLGFRLAMRTDGRWVEAPVTFRAEHVGFRNTIHGGLIATLLDEVMVWACGVGAKRFAYCAEMTVRYRRPVAPGVSMVVKAELVEDRKGRILIARGLVVSEEDGQVHAEATGKYMPMGEGDSAFMGEDFIEDPAVILERGGAA
ncbi:MAG: PaaI family thioesterase [Verrucomicrobiae bacterium]|nr:PaaI family thioesterase [Verrucomicrobiae bacterium]